MPCLPALRLQVMCADMEDPSHYTGYQVALWREIAADLGWADSDWTFSCVDWTAMIDDLVDPNGSCSFAAAGGHGCGVMALSCTETCQTAGHLCLGLCLHLQH